MATPTNQFLLLGNYEENHLTTTLAAVLPIAKQALPKI